MNRIRLVAIAVLTVSGLAVPSAAEAAETTEAFWAMNERPGATVMVDSTGQHHGVVAPEAEAQGLTFESGLYHWSLRCPSCLPAAPARVIQVPDSAALEIPDASVKYTVSLRFKTTKGYGNLAQKGQGSNPGGQIKVENPNGLTKCVFDGAGTGPYVSVASTKATNDGVWHTVSCVHTATSVSIVVDGSTLATKSVRTGPINNTAPFVIGGKSKCDNVTTSCDYYSGYMDWVSVTHGEGQSEDLSPTASFSSACSGLTCTFDGSGSSDPEGSPLGYVWDFGGSGASTAAVATHTFGAAGTYNVRLTVNDPSGHTGTVSRLVTVGEQSSAVAFRAAASTNTNATAPSVTIPSSVMTGDALVLLATTNRNATMATPSGWTLLGVRLDGTDLKSWAFTRSAPAGAAGSRVTTSLDAQSKTSLTLLAYSGAGQVRTAASADESATTSTHRSPSTEVAVGGSRIVSSWVDKTSGHAGWQLPASATVRDTNAGSGSGLLTAATGDSGPVAAGAWPGLTATSGAASAKALSWTIVVPPA